MIRSEAIQTYTVCIKKTKMFAISHIFITEIENKKKYVYEYCIYKQIK